MKRTANVVTLYFFISIIPLLVDGEVTYLKNNEPNEYWTKSFLSLKEQVYIIQSQYVSITSRLAKLEYDIPSKFQCLSNLFQTSNSRFYVDNNAHIYYDTYELSDFEKIFVYSEGDRYGNPDPPSPYATLAQLTAVSNQVVALSASFSTLSSNLTSLSNIVSYITSSISNSQGSLQNLTIAYNRLDEICDNLTSVIKVNSDGSVVMCKSSPIIGRREPTGSASVYSIAQNWDRCCSKFRVSTNTFLESVTLYCDDPSKMPAPWNVYVSTVVQDEVTGNYSFESWHCVNVNTSDFPRCVWTFVNNRKIPILYDRDYLLCISKSNGALYPYVTSPFRQGSFYKPFGAAEEFPPDPPPNSPEPELPRSSPSPQAWFDYLFYYDWEESIFYPKELWSILKFTDDESFTFNKKGLTVESGNITVAGSEVVTSSSLSNMFISEFSNNPNITWEMFCQELQKRLITTAGGSITDCLEVTQMKFNSGTDWKIGDTNICSDIVLLHEDAKIRNNVGNLKLSAHEGDNICAESFLSFESGGQAGIAIIPMGQTEKSVPCLDITDQAVIMLTPRQPVSNIWWGVQSIPSNSCFKIVIDKSWPENLGFNYIIIRK